MFYPAPTKPPHGAYINGKPGNDGALLAGSISARLDRIPATQAIWKLWSCLASASFLSSTVFIPVHRAGTRKERHSNRRHRGLFACTGSGFYSFLFSGFFSAPSVACFWLTVSPPRNLTCCSSTPPQPHHGISGHGHGPELVAFYGRARHWSGTRNHWHVYLRAGAERVRGRALPANKPWAYGRSGGSSVVPAGARQTAGSGWMALGCAIGAHGALFVWFIRRALPESPRWLAQRDGWQKRTR